jgi:L-fuconolactonase
MMNNNTPPHPHFPVRPDWLALHDEPVLDPDIPIVDAHHHLWDRSGNRYFLFDFLNDAGAGHRIEASVFMECGAMYRTSGREELRCIGETEFANGCAAMSASGEYGTTRACAAIIGRGDLLLGDAIAPVLEAHVVAGGGRFRGIRQVAAWHRDPAARGSIMSPPSGLLSSSPAPDAMAVLSRMGLTFDTFIYHTQLAELTSFARACPDVPIIANHIGGAIGIGPYASVKDAVFADWRAGVQALASCDNTYMKLGGLGMRVFGHDFGEGPRPPSSEEVANAWRPFIETCIEAFGAERCMFESNFPVDKGSCSYRVLWNAFKRIASGASADQKDALFRGTATKVYNLD